MKSNSQLLILIESKMESKYIRDETIRFVSMIKEGNRLWPKIRMAAFTIRKYFTELHHCVVVVEKNPATSRQRPRCIFHRNRGSV